MSVIPQFHSQPVLSPRQGRDRFGSDLNDAASEETVNRGVEPRY